MLLNCAAIPDELAEAELFGYVQGAFTDAKGSRVGKLEHASGGTLFLDEVESLSPSIQAKLLRVLQDGIITPLGSNQERHSDCRVISATKQDLLNHDGFRQDLFYRLQVGECHIPPLRERQEDIITLFEYFVMQSCENFKIDYQPISDQNCSVLLSSEWPGNVRELINVATRYVINGFADIGQLIPGVVVTWGNNTKHGSLKQQVNSFEENLIRSKLAHYQGKVSEVLSDLDLERRTFNQKLTRFGINVSDYRK